jgi:hypothetical protein
VDDSLHAVTRRVRKPLIAAVLSLALLPIAGADATAPGPDVQTAARNVCTGVASCTRVADVDVDGDRRTDQVGVVSRQIADGGTVTVRVQTATGRTMRTTSKDVRWFGAQAWFGAAALDGRRGAELVIGDQMGAHFQQFRVLTHRDGRLVTLPAPAVGWYKSTNTATTPRWGVDGSYSFNTGFSRKVTADGVVTLTTTSAMRKDSGIGHRGQTRTYRWESDRWVRVSTTNVRYTDDESAYAVGGWHVKGLRRFV